MENQNSSIKDLDLIDLSFQNLSVKDSSLTDPSVKDSSLTDPPVKDSSLTDPPVKDSILSDPPIKDSSLTDLYLTDTPVKDSILSDPHVKDSPVKDSSLTDPSFSDLPVKDSSLTDQSLTDPSFSNPPVKDSSLTDPSFSDPPVKDSSLTDPSLTNYIPNNFSNKLYNVSLQKDKLNRNIKNPLFIGVDTTDNIKRIIEYIISNSYLENKNLNKEFHVTLVFKPTEEQKNEIPIEGTECNIYLEGYGYSNDAVAIKVEKIVTNTGIDVKYFLKEDGILHITIALAECIKPVNSYLAIKNTYIKFEEIICIKGYIKYYFPEKK